MSNVQDKARQMSRLYYNRGLDCARVRDMSGAMEKLRLSLQFDKTNIVARNLLGLVYFELGEVVSALSEWIVSQNLQPASNIATQYLAMIQDDTAQLRQWNESIRQYNEALRQCREGHDDVAAITLRKAVNHNPKYVKAMLLLALIEIHNGRYTQARRLLTRAANIDKANPMVLRYLKEIEENTESIRSSRAKGRKQDAGKLSEFDEETTARGGFFKERPSYWSPFQVLFGFGLGILALIFVVVPAVRSRTSRDANEKITSYTTTLATQEAKISELEAKIQTSDSTVADAQKQIEEAQTAADSYESLIRANINYQNLDYTSAQENIERVDVSKLSAEAKEIYDSIAEDIADGAFSVYVSSANEAFYLENWSKAVSDYKKALSIYEDSYDVLSLLAQTYENMEDYASAIDTYRTIIRQNPDTRRAEYAEALIEQLGGTVEDTEETAADTDNSPDMDNAADNVDADNYSAAENSADGMDTTGADQVSEE